MSDTTDKFLIAGAEYPVPTVDSFTMSEWEILYDLAGMVADDFIATSDDEARDLIVKRRHPGYVRAMLHIAYQRGNRDKSRREVASVIDDVRLWEAMSPMWDAANEEAEGDDALPPDLTNAPEGSSLRSNSGSSSTSGLRSTTGSAVPA